MTIVAWCSKTGAKSRMFHSMRNARCFIPEACRQDFGGFAYLVDCKRNLVRKLEQYRHGALSYCASGKQASRASGF